MCMLCIFRNSFASRSSVACTVVEKMLRSIENLPQPMQVKFLIFLWKEGGCRVATPQLFRSGPFISLHLWGGS